MRPRTPAVLLVSLALVLLAACGSGDPPVAVDPMSTEAYQKYKAGALQAYDAGDLNAAVQQIARAVALARSEREPYELASRFYTEMAADLDAVQFFEVTTNSWPEFPWGWYYRGLHQGRLNRWEDARDSFSRAVEIEPGFAEGRFREALVVDTLGYRDDALALMKAAFQELERPGPVAPRLARWLREAGRLDEAREVLVAASKTEPGDPELRFEWGELLVALNRPAEAENAFRDAIHRNPTHREAHVRLADVLDLQDRPAEARREREVVQRLDDTSGGRRTLRTLLARNPVDGAAWMALAEIELTDGRYRDALRWLARAEPLGTEPDRVAADRAMAQFGRGDLDAGDRALAVVSDPGSGRVALARAARAIAAGNPEEAVGELDRALAAGPGDREFLWRVSDLLAVVGQVERAQVLRRTAAEARRVEPLK